MNRPIKFRVWSFLDKSFHYFSIEEGYPQGIAGGVSEPQQYTGLKDKNNKEIYEGDVVRFNINVNGYAAAKYLNKKLCTIQFGNCEGYMAFIAIHTNPTDLDDGVILNTRFQEHMVIEGNIFRTR